MKHEAKNKPSVRVHNYHLAPGFLWEGIISKPCVSRRTKPQEKTGLVPIFPLETPMFSYSTRTKDKMPVPQAGLTQWLGWAHSWIWVVGIHGAAKAGK